MSFLSDEQLSQLAAWLVVELSRENSPLATKADLGALRQDVGALRQDMQRIENKVERVEEIGNNVAALVRNTPKVALEFVAPFVVNKGTVVEERAIAKGAKSTWTYMFHEDKFLAVSAAHCATHLINWVESQPPAKKQKRIKKAERNQKENACGPVQGKDTWCFCEVPLSLAPSVKFAYFLPGVIGTMGDHVPTEKDIVALELDQNAMPPEVQELLEKESVLKWRTVAGQHGEIKFQNCSMAGVGLASIVHAPSCAWHLDKKSSDKKYIVFNPDNSEGGHSGTLMFDLSQRDTQLRDQAVGVFVGDKGAGDDLKPRGVICPLPKFSDLTKYEVVSTPLPLETEFELVEFRNTFKGVDRKPHKYVSSSAGSRKKTVYGVFVVPSLASGEPA